MKEIAKYPNFDRGEQEVKKCRKPLVHNSEVEEEVEEEVITEASVGTWYNSIKSVPPRYEVVLVWDDVHQKFRLCIVDEYGGYWWEEGTKEQIPLRHTYWMILTIPEELQ